MPLSALRFDNQFVSMLPGDPEPSARPRQVQHAAWSAVSPSAVAAPALLAHSAEVAALVGFSEADVSSREFADVFGGNALLTGMQPYAACYGGHQFGNWAGQLGDGRAITLGEVVNTRGERWELQLKGAGPTPFSRTADGRAVLRSSIREFLCSEAMYHLGVPTTRALSIVTTGETVLRDMFYDGNAHDEPGAVVCRVAPSFIRFGNFEILAARDDIALLTQLVDFTIARDFPHLLTRFDHVAERRASWYAEICERTAQMVVQWMRVGFVHGVMNTDNMSILGLTIDYGPYGWVDNFDPQWTPNTTDAHGRRYRYSQQPAITQWNLLRLAEAIRPVFESEQPLQNGLDRFDAVYRADYDAMNAAKFGLRGGNLSHGNTNPDDTDGRIMHDGFALLYRANVDYTLFFRALGEFPDVLPERDDVIARLGDVFYNEAQRDEHREAFTAWLRQWHSQVLALGVPFEARRAAMHAVNPRYVLRNYLAQQAIDAATAGDASLVHTLLDVMRRPYADQPEYAHFAARRPAWADNKAGCSMLSCSS